MSLGRGEGWGGGEEEEEEGLLLEKSLGKLWLEESPGSGSPESSRAARGSGGDRATARGTALLLWDGVISAPLALAVASGRRVILSMP